MLTFLLILAQQENGYSWDEQRPQNAATHELRLGLQRSSTWPTDVYVPILRNAIIRDMLYSISRTNQEYFREYVFIYNN